MSALAAVLLAAAAGGAVFGLARLTVTARREWSDADFDAVRRRHGSGVLAAALRAVGEEIGPGGRGAAEARRILEQGESDESARSAAGPVPGNASRRPAPPPPHRA